MRLLTALTTLALLSACDSPDGSVSPDSPQPIVVDEPAAVQAEKARVAALVDAAMQIDTDALLERAKVPFAEDLAYDALDAANLEVVQGSPFALDDDELAKLSAHGFVISARQPLGNFLAGYELIYNADLPVYISADSLLHALHRGYDRQLAETEKAFLAPAVGDLLGRLHAGLAEGEADRWGAEAVADLDEYLAVARSLLGDERVLPQAGGDAAVIEARVKDAMRAEGLASWMIFGLSRKVDVSQFAPRGHYKGVPELERYFRGMMWLGRVDMRLIEVQEDGKRTLNRRALRAVLGLRTLMDADAMADWQRIETLLRSFVGPQDFATMDVLDALADALALPSDDAAGLEARGDEALAKGLSAGTFDVQRIRGQFMNGRLGDPMPLPISVTLFGQRYIVDSHVLANVVWDSVQPDGHAPRMMPDPLDAAYAAFGNDQAASLLETELREYGYAGHLAAMRALMDDRSPEEWKGDLYSGWISALRSLSPDAEIAADPAAHGRPSIWGTEAWGRRMLNTQLGSWTELRHDNLLYAKPSYTGGGGCDYPDGYVEPVPEFYAALIRLAEQGIAASESALAAADVRLARQMTRWWTSLHTVATTLKGLAEQQLTGEPFSADQIMWLEQAVDIAPDDYMGYVVGGWYADLLMLGEDDPYASDRLVADIHTQPTTFGGEVVGNVMHMGTGDVRLMVTTVESCTGPRAYAGPVYATHRVDTRDFERLDDTAWNRRVRDAMPPELPWLEDLVVR